MNNESLTEQLAGWLAGWQDSGPAAGNLAAARLYVLDWLGSALAGGATGPGSRLRVYAESRPEGQSSVVGTGLKRSAEVAALVNGGLSHIVEMDDLDRGSVLHPGAVVIPAALAVAEREQASGADFLAAIVAGYEVAIRIGEAVGKRHYHYFHNTSTCGVFGATVAAGWLLGLTQEQMVWALGNAGTQASGLWEFNTNGDMSKHLHAGRAAANGVLAADLAAIGFSGAKYILEGQRGFFAATAPDADPARVVDGLHGAATNLKIGGVSIKPHASCRHTHPAVDAALALRDQLNGQSAADIAQTIAQVTIDTYQAALDLCDNADPQTSYAAKFSLHYCVAVALCRGQAGLDDFAPENLGNEAVRELMSRTSAGLDPVFEARYPAQWSTRVNVTLADGTTHSLTVDNPKGDPENPLTTAELSGKFRQLAAYGGHTGQSGRLIAWVESLAENKPVAFGSVTGA